MLSEKSLPKKHTYLHRKHKTVYYLQYPPHLLIKEKRLNPNREDLPDPEDLIYTGFRLPPIKREPCNL